MKRLFYKMELRIGEGICQTSEGEILVRNFYYSNGYCIVENNKIKGILTNDLLEAHFDGTMFSFNFLYTDYDNEDEQYGYQGAYKLEAFELPCKINLLCMHEETEDYLYFKFNFISKVEDIIKQQEIEESLEEVGLI